VENNAQGDNALGAFASGWRNGGEMLARCVPVTAAPRPPRLRLVQVLSMRRRQKK